MLKTPLFFLLAICASLGTAKATFMPKPVGWQLAPGAPRVISRDVFLQEMDLRLQTLQPHLSDPIALAANMAEGLRTTLPTAENGLAARALVYKSGIADSGILTKQLSEQIDGLVAFGDAQLNSRLDGLASSLNRHMKNAAATTALEQLIEVFQSDRNDFRTNSILEDLRTQGIVDLVPGETPERKAPKRSPNFFQRLLRLRRSSKKGT